MDHRWKCQSTAHQISQNLSNKSRWQQCNAYWILIRSLPQPITYATSNRSNIKHDSTNLTSHLTSLSVCCLSNFSSFKTNPNTCSMTKKPKQQSLKLVYNKKWLITDWQSYSLKFKIHGELRRTLGIKHYNLGRLRVFISFDFNVQFN